MPGRVYLELAVGAKRMVASTNNVQIYLMQKYETQLLLCIVSYTKLMITDAISFIFKSSRVNKNNGYILSLGHFR